MKKIILIAFISIFLIFIPFVFANYFITSCYLENDKFFLDYDYLIIMVLEWMLVFAVSLVIRKKNQKVVSENPEHSKKIFFISSVLFVLIGLFVLLDGYVEIYGMISSTIGVFNEWPLALAVTWEQYLDGTFFLSALMCIVICFFRKEYFIHKSNTTN